ncbi:MAG: T9SS type A sorting domain-containing protein, partial [Bacteroidota bacterium]
NLTIESRGPNENIFLLQYDKDGQALAATSIGDGATENMSSLAMASGQLAIGGFFNNFFQQDGLEIREDASGFSGFVLTFDLEEKRVNTLKALNSNNNLFVQDVSFSSGNQLSIIGDFIGGASLGNFTFDATTFNPFLARLQLQSTSTTSISDTDIQLQSTSEYLYLYYDLPLEKVAIYDLAGRLQIAVTGEKSINVSALMSGLYVVQIVDAEGLSGGQLFFKP